MKTKISNYIRAGFPILKIRTQEEIRALQTIKDAVEHLGEINRPRPDGIWCWSITRGAVNLMTGQQKPDLQDPIQFLQMISETEQSRAVFVALDMDLKDQLLQRKIKDMIVDLRSGRPLILIDIGMEIPQSLTPFVTVVDLPMPDEAKLRDIANDIMQKEADQKIIAAMSGMTSDGAADALALAIIESAEDPDPQIIMREKCTQLSKYEYIQLIPREKLPPASQIGGLDNLKRFINDRKEAFTNRAREFKLPQPKGILLIGVPGCGKSLAVKCAGDILGLPVVQLNIGAIMGRYVGQSEQNWRNAVQIAEAMAPCVLWLDELDKQFSTGGTGEQHEVTGRIMSGILTWLQEKTAPVFVCATANRIENLAGAYPEMIRQGRWDEMFFVDLPNLQERKEIFEIHIKAVGRNPEKYNVSRFADETRNFSGAEIEGIIRKAMYFAFSENNEMNDNHILRAIVGSTPQWEQSKQSISSLRDWASSRAVPASAKEEEGQKKRNIQK